MNEKIEEIGKPISKEELESDKTIDLAHRNVTEIYDMNDLNLIETPEQVDNRLMNKVLGESKDGWHTMDLKEEEEKAEAEKH